MFKPVDSNPHFPTLEQQVLDFWKSKDIFKKSVEQAQGNPLFSFFEGPPTANGKPGIHHVQARTYKDLFPRFKTMQGFYVPRKAGWDTHGLPVELGVEKKLNLASKREVETYGIDAFNAACRESVFEYEQEWRKFTERMGYWVDLDEAYLTLDKNYIESVWWSLKEIHQKDLLYKGFRVAPYCPRDGTTLSSAEVSDAYKDIQDPSVYVVFPLTEAAQLGLPENTAFLVWTTTPWTLPYNVAVALHPTLAYVAVLHENFVYIVAESLHKAIFGEDAQVIQSFLGSELQGVRYRAPYTEAYEAEGNSKAVWFAVTDTYVSDSDGTGIVHTAPAFGEDDMRLAKTYDLPVLVGVTSEGNHRFGPWKGVFFRDANTEIRRDLKAKGVLWKDHNFNHSYPHCWRCGTPLMYFATESWFIRNSSQKERLIELNQTIDWHPQHIKNGRYGAWLENLVDWNLSRNRFWGTPLPIWETESGERFHVVGSYAELKALSNGMIDPDAPDFDPHRPFIDGVVLYHPETQEPMRRVPYVIDVWYDSGAMPFAQHHFPFENKNVFEATYPADFIAEAIDQTRGWFNSLHQIGTLVFDQVAYRSVICHGHILDEKGQKMSKSKGNIIGPWEMFDTYGADAVRWYMCVSAQPELSRRFGPKLLEESFRQYFLTLWNVYSFFVLYANLDLPDLKNAPEVSVRPEVDRWLLAKQQVVIRTVTDALSQFDPTAAARALQDFVVEDVSNWYVRRNRRRFWKSGEGTDLSAYATLHTVLSTIAKLSAPFTPFFSEMLYQNLVLSLDSNAPESVHLCMYPTVDSQLEDERRVSEMDAVVRVVTLGRAVRGQHNLKTRQPLQKALLRARSKEQTASLGRFVDQIREELNVKEVELLEQFDDLVQYTLKPNLPVVGKRFGKHIPALKKALALADANSIARHVRENTMFEIEADGIRFELAPNDVLVDAQSPEGYAALEDAGYLVAFDTTLTESLKREGIMRDLVRVVQDSRKQAGLDVSDFIDLALYLEEHVLLAAQDWLKVIEEETQASIQLHGYSAEGSEGFFVAEFEGGRLVLQKATVAR